MISTKKDRGSLRSFLFDGNSNSKLRLTAIDPMPASQFIRTALNRKLTVAVFGFVMLGAIWLLVGRAGNRVKITDLKLTGGGKPGFTLLPPQQTGITFANNLRDDLASANQLLNIGSGVAAGDYDGDGLCDLYFCSMTGRNVLYKN